MSLVTILNNLKRYYTTYSEKRAGKFRRWLWGIFDFWTGLFGWRLRKDVADRLEKEDEDEKRGKNISSPEFDDVDEAFDWLDSQK